MTGHSSAAKVAAMARPVRTVVAHGAAPCAEFGAAERGRVLNISQPPVANRVTFPRDAGDPLRCWRDGTCSSRGGQRRLARDGPGAGPSTAPGANQAWA